MPTSIADRLVYVEAWQMECCGEPFRTGSVVRWTVTPPDHDFLDQVLGPALSSEVTDAEEHHQDAAEVSTPVITGVVQRIRTVSCQYAKPEGASALYPVENTSVLLDVPSIDSSTRPGQGLVFLGWLVSISPATR